MDQSPGCARGAPKGPARILWGGRGSQGISHWHRMVPKVSARILRGGRGGAGGAHLRTVVHKWATRGRMWAPVGLACVPLAPTGAPVGHMCTLASASGAHESSSARSLAIPCAPLAHQCADVRGSAWITPKVLDMLPLLRGSPWIRRGSPRSQGN